MDLFKIIEEGGDFVDSDKTTIPGGKVFKIAYLPILRTGVTEKAYEQLKDMHIGLKFCQAFKDDISQDYRRYQISKKLTAAAHGYGASENHTQKTDAQVNIADALQEISSAAMEEKEAMANRNSIKLTLSQILTQAQEIIYVLSKQLQAL